ncbi:MAG: XRE family transcriptional regulator [Hungatella sp.]|jgi:plasmid maintenance system antidote protein VapI|nr:XRE family transcriptional regulator [Hungatella sp.]
MYKNLEAELARIGATRKDVANILGRTPGTVSLKMNGKSPFTIPEARILKTFLGADKSIEYLFAQEQRDTR